MTRKKIATMFCAGLISIGLAACGSSNESNNNESAGGGESSPAASTDSNTLVGAGSTLVAPLVAKWQPAYNEENEVAVTYGGIGSGGGIAAITAREVDFGASDAPLSEEQFEEANGVVQIPWALAATVVAYNVEGVESELHLSGPVLAEIWEGKITQWNDPKIAELNHGVHLPSTNITPIHRSDGSGDTYAFTNYLSHVSEEWKESIGVGTEVAFPGGVGGKGNSGVGGALSSTNGAIAYIAIAYVLSNEFDFANIENAAGEFPAPGIKSIEAAAEAFPELEENNAISIVDPPSSATGAYPISTYTYSIVPQEAPKAETLKPFLEWAVTTGQEFTEELDFAPLPEAIVEADKEAIATIGSS